MANKTPPPPPCPDWVLSHASNVHVAKDRSWFQEDYVSIKTFVTDAGGNRIEVIGLGTVRLQTQTLPNGRGRNSHGAVTLKNVLHAPSVFSNIIGQPIDNDYVHYELPAHMVEGFPGPVAYIANRSDGCIQAYAQTLVQGTCLYGIQLSRPPVGPRVGYSPLNPTHLHVIRAFWPESERQKVLARSPPLTRGENAYMDDFYGDECHFLREHGLSIDDEDDRDKGRLMVRRFMGDDGAVGYKDYLDA